MKLRHRLLVATDRTLAIVLVGLVAGTALAFGGRVWWAPLALAAGGFALAAACVLKILLEGRFAILKSPLTAIGILVLSLGALQVVPLPGAIASKVSPSSRSVYGLGFLADRAREIDPAVALPEGPIIRSPISIERAFTVRWLAGALLCLLVFWAVTRFADRLGRVYLIWGSVVAVFFLNTALAAVQLVCGTDGLFGFLRPGSAPIFAPNLVDIAAGPGATLLRASAAAQAGHAAWLLPKVDRQFLLGSQMGGMGAYLALGSLGLPLALSLLLQLIAPRGSREPLADRLRESGRGSLAGLLLLMVALSALIVGLLAGPMLSLPFAAGLILVGFPAAFSTGLRWGAVGLLLLTLGSLGAGVAGGQVWAASFDMPPPVAPIDRRALETVWSDSLPILADFPLLGTGLGTFATIIPYYKSTDAASTTAMSSLLQWTIESGLAGLGLLAMAGGWCLLKVPGAIRKVGTADRSLAFGLIGAATGFTLFSTVHWTIELVSVALAASAVAGTMNRWLAGGTDLFVERG